MTLRELTTRDYLACAGGWGAARNIRANSGIMAQTPQGPKSDGAGGLGRAMSLVYLVASLLACSCE
jgi:hypothetical protein